MLSAFFPDKPRAAAAIDALVNGGVGDDLVNVAMHEGRVKHGDLGRAGGRSARRMLQGVVFGAVVGGVLGGTLAVVFAAGTMLVGTLVVAIAGKPSFFACLAIALGSIAPSSMVNDEKTRSGT